MEQMKLGDLSLQVEEASPISSRPPAMTSAAGLFDDELLAGELCGAGGGGGGNRWPRKETISLLKIRSEMDTAFKDANPKGPLWEEVSRKLGELGYRRNAKKCKEKFENVHKYYKRTKEGRAGRQDGKSYRFFTELEALTASTSSSSMQILLSGSIPPPHPTVAVNPSPVSSSIRFQPSVMFSVTHHPSSSSTQPLTTAAAGLPSTSATPFDFIPTPNIGISFSSDTGSFASDSSDENMGINGGEERKCKRKRTSSSPRIESTNETIMEFFDSLVKQVMLKQEVMQQRFLKAIEKREQDRLIREEAWKRQEEDRHRKEHELIAQERAMIASRDSAIITFLQKITGHTVQLPSAITVPVVAPTAPPPPPTPQPPAVSIPPLLSTPIQVHQSSQQQEPASNPVKQHQQQLQRKTPRPESSSSRWPKAEIIALIQLRSGLDFKYQETGPKGPLWEDISKGMERIGYKRNAKRCKEKWENINKYYKKVKESHKKRPDHAKTCPYFHQLDELYRNGILGSNIGAGGNSQIKTNYEGLTGTLLGAASGDNQPEDIVKTRQYQNQPEQDLIMRDDYDNEESDELGEENQEDKEARMGYRIGFDGQKSNSASSKSNGGGNGGSSFMTMVQ